MPEIDFLPIQEEKMVPFDKRLHEHSELTRRYFLKMSGATIVVLGASPLLADNAEMAPQIKEAIAKKENRIVKS